MHTHPVARVYAEALLEVARKRGGIDNLGAQLEEFVSLLGTQPEVRRFLESPVIDSEDKKRAVEDALRGRSDDMVANFIGLLIDKGRIGDLDEISAAYRDLADEAGGRTRVQAATAVPLPDDLRQKLQGLLNQKLRCECVLETEVRPALLGGLVLTIGDRVYDGSVSGRLRRLRESMMRSSGYED